MKSSKIFLGILAVVIAIVAVSLVARNLEAPTMPSSGIDTSAWKTYSNARPPFGIKAPADLVLSSSTIPTVDGPYLLALQFPKDIYFSTVLKDEAYTIVTASSSCPAIGPGGLVGDGVPTLVSFNGINFTRNESNDVAAGNRYQTIVYDTNQNGLCYRITFFDHGANGAGLYLSDMDSIKAADAIHDSELSKIKAVVEGIVGTFSLSASQ